MMPGVFDPDTNEQANSTFTVLGATQLDLKQRG